MSKALVMLKRGLQKPKELIARSSFSKNQLLIFILVFGGIGGWLLWHSFAAGPLVASLQAEQMSLPASASVITDVGASGGKAIQLLSNGAATGTLSLTSNSDSLTVTARGSQCQGAPLMSVAIDGANVLSNVAVSASSWSAYSATKALGAGNHTVSITFSGDYAKTKGKRSCDRNLYVDVSNFYGPVTAPTPAPTVALSASPASLTTGQAATLTWNSTNATSCTASGAWSGVQATSGSVSTGALNVNSTYALTCTGAGGSASASATVSVLGITSNIKNGQSLAGSLQWIATPVNLPVTSITKVEFYIDGTLKWTENASPYYYNGDNNSLDTTTLSNGNHTFLVKATLTDTTTASSSVVSGVSNSTAAPPPTGSLLFDGNFETGNFSQFNNTYCYMSWSCSVVAAPGGHTGYVGRFETRYNDYNAYGNGASVRAQIQVAGSDRVGESSAWHWELYLPADWKGSSSGWGDSVFEWHHYSTNPDGLCHCTSSPPWTFGIYQNRLVTRIVKSNVESQGIYWDQYDLGPVVPGSWTSYDVRAKWSSDPAVAVGDVYVNGVLKAHITGHPNEFDGYFDYVLLGVYHANVTDVGGDIQYYDNIRKTTY